MHWTGLGLITVYSVEGALFVVRIKVRERLAHDQSEFDFEVHIHALGPQDRAFGGKQDGAWRLEEEEGLLGPLVVEFGDVVAIVIQEACY